MLMIEAVDGFEVAPSGTTLSNIETPIPVIDVEVAERHVLRWQSRCESLQLANRPHVKTHKSSAWARVQMRAGAVGLTCQTLGEAETMADAGVRDILVSVNIVGSAKCNRLCALARRAQISTVTDSTKVTEALSRAASAGGVTLRMLVECDVGLGRCGVTTPEAAADLAGVVTRAPGLSFAGFLTYPPPGARLATAEFMSRASALCAASGLEARVISVGGTPDLASDAGLAIATEYRAGTYIYNDRSLVARGACSAGDVALTVLSTVVSCKSADTAIVDAGSKALSSDLLGLADYGEVRGRPAARLVRLDEEHGYLRSTEGALGLKVDERIRLLPNHACVISNLFDRVALSKGDILIGYLQTNARRR